MQVFQQVRRRLATSSYRKQQTTKCHRQARRQFATFRIMRQMNDNKWEIYKAHSGELYTVEQHKDCECSDSPEENLHRPLCLVCPYVHMHGQSCWNQLHASPCYNARQSTCQQKNGRKYPRRTPRTRRSWRTSSTVIFGRKDIGYASQREWPRQHRH
uniref:SWIM-type domain-containing protein n=1 Tax=Haemonchus contortus TaxID=6289 RepID=A0A7I4XWY9_HAECO